MNDSPATYRHEPVPAMDKPFARRAARFSLFAPLITIAFRVITPEPKLRETKMIVGSICIIIILAGLIFGIIALAGTRKHGRKGVRGIALAGTIVNGVLILVSVVGMILLIPALRRVDAVFNARYTLAEMEAMPRVISDSRLVLDEEIGFRIEIPGDFQDNPQPQPLRVLYSFLRMDANGLNIGINIDRLDGRISREAVGSEAVTAMRNQLPSASEVEHVTMPWKTHQLDAFVMRFRIGDMVLCSYAVQVPLAREAIQVNVAGPVEMRQECQELTALLLAGLKGLSNWDPLPVLQEHAGIRQSPE